MLHVITVLRWFMVVTYFLMEIVWLGLMSGHLFPNASRLWKKTQEHVRKKACAEDESDMVCRAHMRLQKPFVGLRWIGGMQIVADLLLWAILYIFYIRSKKSFSPMDRLSFLEWLCLTWIGVHFFTMHWFQRTYQEIRYSLPAEYVRILPEDSVVVYFRTWLHPFFLMLFFFSFLLLPRLAE